MMTGEAETMRQTEKQTELYIQYKRQRRQRRETGKEIGSEREKKNSREEWESWSNRRGEKQRHTSALSNAEVECGAGLRRDVEVDCAVVPSLVSINRSQHLHHLRGKKTHGKERQ